MRTRRKEKDTPIILITIGPYSYSSIRATCQVKSDTWGRSWRTIETFDLEKVLPQLCEGGYVVDLTPLQESPNIVRWIWEQPLCNGQLRGEEMDWKAGPADEVSAQWIARYWVARGARVGYRVGRNIRWIESDQPGEGQERRLSCFSTNRKRISDGCIALSGLSDPWKKRG